MRIISESAFRPIPHFSGRHASVGIFFPGRRRAKLEREVAILGTRVLWAVSSVGAGHVYRDVLIAQRLARRTGWEIVFAAGGAVPQLLRREGLVLAGELAEMSLPVADGWLDLGAFAREWRRQERANRTLSRELLRRLRPRLVVSDELPSVLGEARRQGTRTAYLTDFVTLRPARRRTPRHWGYPLLRPWLDAYLRRPLALADLGVLLDDAAAVPRDLAGWVRRHRVFCAGTPVRPGPAPHPEPGLVIATAGGSAAGGFLLRAALEAFPAVRRAFPQARLLVVAGPSLDPASLPTAGEGVEVAGFRPNLVADLARAAVVVGMAGLATLAELRTRSRAWAVLCPVGRHWEEEANALKAAAQGWARVIFREQLSAPRLAAQIGACLGAGAAPRPQGSAGDPEAVACRLEALGASG